jgi:hypothetical protein
MLCAVVDEWRSIAGCAQNQITEEMTEFPKRKFLLIGFLDMCQVCAGSAVSGSSLELAV